MNELRVTLVGNLTADPELRFTPAGDAVASFTVAQTPRRYDRNTNQWADQDAIFLRVTVWRQQGENVAESLQRGDRVTVEGTMRQRSYKDREDQTRTVYEVTADEVGVALRYATAKPNKVKRSKGFGNGAEDDSVPEDPWATTEPANV